MASHLDMLWFLLASHNGAWIEYCVGVCYSAYQVDRMSATAFPFVSFKLSYLYYHMSNANAKWPFHKLKYLRQKVVSMKIEKNVIC